MTMTIQVDIVSAEAKIFSGKATYVVAPAINGEVGIKPLHAQMLTRLKPGQVRISLAEGGEEVIYTNGGLLEVQPHQVSVLSDIAIRADELDEKTALEAKQAAERVLQGRSSEMEYSKALSELAEAAAQIQAIQAVRKKLKR